ncbi:hypothetical protein [Acinetobacter zhairhuonensis]|uniref:hypothetical protein n=1 Tax=Acinetobacter sp. A7.4 TaxID=2919921 RepID=UPI001F4F4E01|nr:hypothetical protein [Acinetobacter sp. A7.4]MCJ8163143.1 hypothetical protein [Acinetobacter sp. A7.4]
MKIIYQAILAALIALSSVHALADLYKKTLLYVGTGHSNNGVVTTSQNHLNDTTKIIGYTIDDASAEPDSNFIEVFTGNTAGINAGVVSPDTNHAGGSTESIGYLSKKPIRGGKKLYVGEGTCNNGVVTISTKHLGCATHFIGYTLPK